MTKAKKELKLYGRLMRPIKVGNTAVVSAGGRVFHTSRVVALHEQRADYIHFETQNRHYHLSMRPFPLAMVSLLPERLAACA